MKTRRNKNNIHTRNFYSLVKDLGELGDIDAVAIDLTPEIEIVDATTDKREFLGASAPSYGPTAAFGMSSSTSSLPAVGGYGNSYYGGLGYGEAINKDYWRSTPSRKRNRRNWF